MKVSSELGKGSAFRLLLPSAGALVVTSPPELPAETAWRGEGTVLVADDETAVRIVAKRLLEAFGYTVVQAKDGREALDYFVQSPAEFTAVLLDLTMPRMDGLEAFAEIRRLRGNIPVVLMSGYNEQDAVSRFAGQGLAAFVQKPFSPAELREAFRLLREPEVAAKTFNA